MLLLAELEPSGWHSWQGSIPGARLLGTRLLEGDPAGGPHSIGLAPRALTLAKQPVPPFLPSLPWLCVSLAVCSL